MTHIQSLVVLYTFTLMFSLLFLLTLSLNHIYISIYLLCIIYCLCLFYLSYFLLIYVFTCYNLLYIVFNFCNELPLCVQCGLQINLLRKYLRVCSVKHD